MVCFVFCLFLFFVFEKLRQSPDCPEHQVVEVSYQESRMIRAVDKIEGDLSKS